MIKNIGANTFFIFMGFDILATAFCFIFVKETRGKLLESAAGTEWEVAEKSADAMSLSEKGDNGTTEPHTAVDTMEGHHVVADAATGKQLEVVAAHDTFGSNLKHR